MEPIEYNESTPFPVVKSYIDSLAHVLSLLAWIVSLFLLYLLTKI